MKFLGYIKLILLLLFFGTGAYAGTSDTSSTFLVMSDIHLATSSHHLMAFAPSVPSVDDDLDPQTYQALMSTIKKDIDSGALAKPAFIVLLGDLVGHHRASPDDVFASEQQVFQTIKAHFPTTPIFYSFGNNDSFLVDYGPFRMADSDAKFKSPLDVMKIVWPEGSMATCAEGIAGYPCMMPPSAADGYYAAYIQPKLRLLSLNTVLFSSRSFGAAADASTKQLLWLAQQLAQAHAQHEAVLMIMHIPPGNNVYRRSIFSDTAFWTADASQVFLTLVEKYHDDLIGILAGHTHKDELKVIQNPQHQPLTGVYLNAALSTAHGNAPSIRYYVLKQTQSRWMLDDYMSYYFMQSAAGRICIQPLYRFRDEYCVAADASMTDCLAHLSVDKVQKNFCARNASYNEIIQLPQNLVITLTAQDSP